MARTSICDGLVTESKKKVALYRLKRETPELESVVFDAWEKFKEMHEDSTEFSESTDMNREISKENIGFEDLIKEGLKTNSQCICVF